jgi:hypothetical protein
MRFEDASPISAVLIWSHGDEDDVDDDDARRLASSKLQGGSNMTGTVCV